MISLSLGLSIPILLNQFLNLISSPATKTSLWNNPYMLLILMFLSGTIKSITNSQALFLGQHIGFQIKIHSILYSPQLASHPTQPPQYCYPRHPLQPPLCRHPPTEQSVVLHPILIYHPSSTSVGHILSILSPGGLSYFTCYHVDYTYADDQLLYSQILGGGSNPAHQSIRCQS